MKRSNTCIVGIPEGEEIEKETENIFKAIMAENFSKLERETSRSMRPKEPQIGRTQTGVHQDTLNC